MELQIIMINIDTYLNRHGRASSFVIHGLVVYFIIGRANKFYKQTVRCQEYKKRKPK